MKENRHLVRSNLIMGGLYSCFGFLGLFLVFVWNYFLSKPSPFGPAQIDPLVTYMQYFVIGVSLFMFWFAYHIYKTGLAHDRKFYGMIDSIDENLERIK